MVLNITEILSQNLCFFKKIKISANTSNFKAKKFGKNLGDGAKQIESIRLEFPTPESVF